MNHQDFAITIENLPRKRLLGNWTRLNAAMDKNECLDFRQAFCRRLQAVPGLEEQAAYSVCVNMKDNLDCEYWTAVEAGPDSPAPKGTVAMELDGGCYACLELPSGQSPAESYDSLFKLLESSQPSYAVDRDKPCFEVYDRNGQSGQVKIFIPCR